MFSIKAKKIITVLSVNILILACGTELRNSAVNPVLTEEKFCAVLADMFLEMSKQHWEAMKKADESPRGSATLLDVDVSKIKLQDIYSKYNINKYVLYASYDYYFKLASIASIEKLESIYRCVSDSLNKKSKYLKL